MNKMKEKGIDMSDTLTYNSGREDLVIPEYGRGIHTMVQHMMSIADRAERTKCAEAIVSVMGSVVPPEGSEEEGRHKLWNQLHQMTEYQMDVDSPFEKPEENAREESPERLDYPSETSRAGHFGRTLQGMVDMAVKMEDGEEKSVLVVKLANTLKVHFLTWNRKQVERAFIVEQLKEMSGGKIVLPEDAVLESSADILRSIRKTSDALDRRKPSKKNNNQRKGGNKGGRRR